MDEDTDGITAAANGTALANLKMTTAIATTTNHRPLGRRGSACERIPPATTPLGNKESAFKRRSGSRPNKKKRSAKHTTLHLSQQERRGAQRAWRSRDCRLAKLARDTQQHFGSRRRQMGAPRRRVCALMGSQMGRGTMLMVATSCLHPQSACALSRSILWLTFHRSASSSDDLRESNSTSVLPSESRPGLAVVAFSCCKSCGTTNRITGCKRPRCTDAGRGIIR